VKEELEIPPVLEQLGSTPVGVASPLEIEAQSAKLLPWLEDAIGEVPRRRVAEERRRRNRTLAKRTGFVLAAALLPLGFFVMRGETTEEARVAKPALGAPNLAVAAAIATLVDGAVDSGDLEVLPGSQLGLAGGVRTKAGARAVLRAESGYEMTLLEESSLRLLEGTPKATRLELKEGEVRLSVPKLGADRSLEVVTSDARVIVHGTTFSVRLRETGEKPLTCVAVSEGRVEVVYTAGERLFLNGGEASPCGGETAEEAAVRGPEARSERAPVTTLTIENRLLGRALAAERERDYRKAAKAYQELLTRFPRSQFRPEAEDGLRRVNTPPAP
jgi:FecR protein